jgi:hypothetical protein
MFSRLAPQRVRHSDGFTIQIGSRYSIEYLDDHIRAEVETDMLSQIVPFYPETLKIRSSDARLDPPSQEERALILDRIKSGLEFMEIKYDVQQRRPHG